jgi:hypothetical protein
VFVVLDIDRQLIDVQYYCQVGKLNNELIPWFHPSDELCVSIDVIASGGKTIGLSLPSH